MKLMLLFYKYEVQSKLMLGHKFRNAKVMKACNNMAVLGPSWSMKNQEQNQHV